MADLERVYPRLPRPLQEAAVSAVGWRTRRTRYDGAFRRRLAEALARDAWDTERLLAYRNERVAEVLRAAQAIPYWRALLSEHDLDPNGIHALEDLASLPRLRKSDVQDAPARFTASGPGLPRPVHVHTSGTTGAGLRLVTTRDAVQRQWANFWRFCSRHGIPFLGPCALFAGRSVVPARQQQPPFWRVSGPTRQLVFSAYHMRDETLGAYVAELRRRRVPWIHGYPSTVGLLASHIVDHGLDLGYPVRWVTLSSETLLPHQREAIERAFGVRPRQHYSNTEAVAAISECELGAFHVDEDFAAVELVAEGPAGAASVVGTSLWNPLLPLVRYETADRVVPGGACACGRGGRIVDAIDGRIESSVVLRDGSRVGRLDHIFKDMVNVREAQIVQPRAGELVIRVVRGSRFGPGDERRLLAETRRRLGERVDVSIEYAARIERSRSGKIRFVVSQDADVSSVPVAVEGGVR